MEYQSALNEVLIQAGAVVKKKKKTTYLPKQEMHRRHRFDPWVGRSPWRRKWQPTPVFLPGKFCGQRSLGGYRPWNHRVGHA